MSPSNTLFFAALSVASPIMAQGSEQASPARPGFEVASVRVFQGHLPRPAAPATGDMPPPPPPPFSIRSAPQTLTILHATLMECVTWAYGVRSWQISAPDWFRMDRYDIVGRTASPVEAQEMKLMLQRLLEERFRMMLRREKKEAAVMALVADRSGPKFKPASPDTSTSVDAGFVAATGGVRFLFRNTPLDRLEGILSGPDWDPVINLTGMAGGFDLTFERPHLDDGAGGSNFGAIQTALQKQLGLKLERRRLPLDYLVIERATRIPTEN